MDDPGIYRRPTARPGSAVMVRVILANERTLLAWLRSSSVAALVLVVVALLVSIEVLVGE